MEKINKRTLKKIINEGGSYIKKIKPGWYVRYALNNDVVKVFGGKYIEYITQYITTYRR